MNEPKRVLHRSIKIFWSFLKIAALILLALWLMRFPGDLYIRVLDTEISMTMGFAVAAAFLSVGVIWLILGFFKSIFGFGSLWRQRRLSKHMQRASEHFDQAISAFFTEDYSTAMDAFSRAIKYNPKREGIYTVFLAISALNAHKREQAYMLFLKLTNQPPYVLMGYFGLYHLNENDPIPILEQARLKTENHPWILKRLFEEYSKETHLLEPLHKAQQLIPLLAEKRALTKEERKEALANVLWRQALYYKKQKEISKAVELAKQSYEQHPFLSGPVIMLAEEEPLEKAKKMLLKAFTTHPHPDLTQAMLKLLPPTVDTFYTLEETLSAHSSPEVQYFLAQLAYQAQLWGRAKQILSTVKDEHFDARFYLLKASLLQK